MKIYQNSGMDWIALLAMKVRASLILTIDRSLLNILRNMFWFGFGQFFLLDFSNIGFLVSLGQSSEIDVLHLFLSLMLSCIDETLSSFAF